MNIASMVIAVQVIDPVGANKVGLFLNHQLIMERYESDERARAIMEEVASNLEVFAGKKMTTAKIELHVGQFTWDEIIMKIRDMYARESGFDQLPLLSVNGGESFSRAPEGARMAYPRHNMNTGIEGEYHVNLTHEGVIIDLWTGKEGRPLDHHAGTVAYEFSDLLPLVTH